MKSILPLLILVIVFSSCTTAYKSGQTPDDVYYSPARPEVDYVRSERNDDRRYRYDEEAYRDDRYLRMKIRNRRYTGLYDDYYSYNPYYYHYYHGSLPYHYSPWNSYSYWNYYYNPYCMQPVTVKNPVRNNFNKPRTFDLGVYNPAPANGTGSKGPRTYTTSNPTRNSGNNNNYRGSGTDAGGFLRDVFSGGSSSNSKSSSGSSSSSSSSSRNSSGSSSSGSNSSSSGSKGSTNAPARKF